MRWLPLALLLSSCNLLYDGRCIGRDKSRDITLSTSLPANKTYFQVTAVEHEREEMRRGEVRLRMETDLPGQEQLEQALQIAHFNDWDYPNCS